MVLLVIGFHDPGRIAKFKRTAKFTEEDYEVLRLILDRFNAVITTPNILTEVNSFLNQLDAQLKPDFYGTFAKQIADLEEVYIPSVDIGQTVEFTLFGPTEAGIASLAQGNYLVLTEDLRLAVYLQYKGIEAINFNHFRNYI
jgi:hypothetical protein